jgi:hypothetical protein
MATPATVSPAIALVWELLRTAAIGGADPGPTGTSIGTTSGLRVGCIVVFVVSSAGVCVGTFTLVGDSVGLVSSVGDCVGKLASVGDSVGNPVVGNGKIGALVTGGGIGKRVGADELEVALFKSKHPLLGFVSQYVSVITAASESVIGLDDNDPAGNMAD